MENKSNFKVTLKGACVSKDAKTEMMNKDFEGDLVAVIAFKRIDDEHVDVNGALVGVLDVDVPVEILKCLRGVLGAKEYYRAGIIVGLEDNGDDDSDAAEMAAAEAEEAAEALVNGEAGDDE